MQFTLHNTFKILMSGIFIYSLTSLSCLSPSVASEQIFQHAVYLIKSPPSHLAKWWRDNGPCKLHPIYRHFTPLSKPWSVSVSVKMRSSMSVSAASCSHPCCNQLPITVVSVWRIMAMHSASNPVTPPPCSCLECLLQLITYHWCDSEH